MTRLAVCLVIGLFATRASAQTGNDPPRPVNPSSETASPTRSPGGAARLAVLATLHSRLPPMEFDQVSLHDVFAWLNAATETNIVVRWHRLAELGIERDQPISIGFRNLRLSQVLWLVMNQVAADGGQLAYRADPDLILVSTAEDLGQAMVLKVYDVRDLTAPRLRSPEIVITREHEVVISTAPTVAAGAVAVTPIIQRVGSGVLLGGEDGRVRDNDGVDGESDRHLQELIDVITTTIEPDSWAANGGIGTISAFRGKLVVRNTPLVHQAIGGYLSQGAKLP